MRRRTIKRQVRHNSEILKFELDYREQNIIAELCRLDKFIEQCRHISGKGKIYVKITDVLNNCTGVRLKTLYHLDYIKSSAKALIARTNDAMEDLVHKKRKKKEIVVEDASRKLRKIQI